MPCSNYHLFSSAWSPARAAKGVLSRSDMTSLVVSRPHEESRDRTIGGSAIRPQDRMEALRHFSPVLGQVLRGSAVRLGLSSCESKQPHQSPAATRSRGDWSPGGGSQSSARSQAPAQRSSETQQNKDWKISSSATPVSSPRRNVLAPRAVSAPRRANPHSRAVPASWWGCAKVSWETLARKAEDGELGCTVTGRSA